MNSQMNNHVTALRELVLLQKRTISSIIGSGGTGGLATEGTLTNVLNAIIASDQDIEILLVRDTGNSDKVVQQIVNYETGTPVITYKDVDGADYTPVGPLEYLDPSAVMNLLLTQTIIIADSLEPVVWQAGKNIDVATAISAATVFTEPVLLTIDNEASGTVDVILFNDGTTVSTVSVWEVLQSTIVIKKIVSVDGGLSASDVRMYQK